MPAHLPRLVLASQSPARLQTLRNAGLRPDVVVSGVDEDGVEADSAGDLALRLARMKAIAVAANAPRSLVIGCDSVLELDGEVFGKPADADEATARWRQMRGRAGVLHTGHCVIDTHREVWVSRGAATQVRFAHISDEEIDAYVATGEPLLVAGAFTVDSLGGAFIDRVDGDPSTVVGMSVSTLRRLVRELGVEWTDLWNTTDSSLGPPEPDMSGLG